MTARRPLLVRLLALAVALGVQLSVSAGENPVGKVIARIVPVKNKGITNEMIASQMYSKPGKPYDEALIQEDVRRLLNSKWFAPGGVRIDTSVGADGQVTVFVQVVELASVVREVIYQGAQHLSDDELSDLTGIRRGSPLNPAMNQLAAQAIQNKLREDGRYYASVNLVEGGKLTDGRVVFQIVEGPVVRVRGVEFKGNQIASGGRLRTQILTSPPVIPGVVTPFSQKFQPGMMQEDKKRILNYYHKLGHLEARIFEQVVPHPDTASEVTVVYHIEEGPEYKVDAVRIDGNKTLGEDRLKKYIDLTPGESYDRDKVQIDIARIKNFYGNKGFSVGVEENVYAVPGKPGVVNVHYQIFEGSKEPARVGRIIVRGNTITDQRVILNQLGLYPGQILQFPRLKEAEMNLARLQLFDPQDPPRVEVEQNDFDSVYKDVVVTVKETRTGMIALSTNVNSDAGINGSLVVNQRNFDILRVPTSVDDLLAGKAFRGGGQEMRIEAMPGNVFQRYAVTWREPYLFDSRFGLTASGYYYNRGFAEYNEDRYGGRFTLDYRFADSPIWRANVSTRIEGVNIDDIPYWATPAITNDRGESTLVGLRGGITRDTRDSYLMPTSGSVLDVGVEQVLGDYTFPIGTAEFSTYYAPKFLQRRDGSGKHVVALRSQLSVEGDNAPVFERFYGGGFRSLRGFSFRGVGPYENFLNVGGTFAFLNTVEYQLPILANDKLWFVAFCDHGTIERDIAIRDYRVSVGVGMRISVAAMGPLPIALDFAFPITKGPYDNKQLFSFYVGWFGGQ